MKKQLFFLFVGLSFFTVLFSIPNLPTFPQKMSYQAVVRNNSNNLVVSSAIGLRISILQSSTTGSVVYSETHSATTNANGLITIEIGGGTVLSGAFTTINWGAGPYFLKTEIDPNGACNYTIIGTSQLLSVPYAMYAKTAETVTLSGTEAVFNGWDKNAFDDFNGDYTQLTNRPNIKDSISTYGFDGDYKKLINAANIKDSISKYGFDGDYKKLLNTPSIKDSISTYSFDRDYKKLTNLPNIKDSINTFGFSGKYSDLSEKPTISTAPVGSGMQYFGSTAPEGYLLCDGSAVSRTTYATLYSIIGSAYGSGDGSTTFNLPDLRGRVSVGRNASNTKFDVLGEKGGEETHILTTAELPSHNHDVNPAGFNTTSTGSHLHTVDPPNTATTTDGYHTHDLTGTAVSRYGETYSGNGGDGYANSVTGTSGAGNHAHTLDISAFNSAYAGDHTHTIDVPNTTSTSTGSGTAHNVLQPYIVLNYIIKY